MSNYLSKHKWHLVALTLLLIIVGVSWKLSAENKNLSEISNDKTPTTTAFAVTPPVTSEQLPITDKTQNTNNVTQTPPQLQITNYKLQVTTTSTAIEAMKKSGMDFKTKTFSGLGEFVEEIGGLKNDPQNGKYWIYFINGETAKLGISTQIVKPNDLIEWKYGNTDF